MFRRTFQLDALKSFGIERRSWGGARWGQAVNLGFNVSSSIVLFSAFTIELLILLRARYVGDLLKVVDLPDSIRKRHPRATPLVGGLAIMVPLLLWTGAALLLGHASDEKFEQAIFLCGAGATLVGFADDQSSTSPASRMLSLFVLSTIALVLTPQLLPAAINWGSFAPFVLSPWMSYGLIALAMAGFVNAVNMADGQNGIVTGMFVIWSICLTLTSGHVAQGIAQVLFAASVMAFLFNMAGRIFLGDAGTYGVTFVFGILTIEAHNSGAVSAETVAVWFFIPVMDCLRLIISRVLKGVAPSDGDRNHFHHRLQDLVGKTYGLIIYLGAVGSSSLMATLVPRLSVVCLLLLSAFYFGLTWLDAEFGFGQAAAATVDAERSGAATQGNAGDS